MSRYCLHRTSLMMYLVGQADMGRAPTVSASGADEVPKRNPVSEDTLGL